MYKYTKNKAFKIGILFIVFLLLFFFKDFSNSVNSDVENFYAAVRGQLQPDTNIVLITIDANDIARIGPWPIKRSYYALLINSLSKLNVKKIGLEVFLSPRFRTQAIYDNLLTREIEKAKNVVLGSVVGEIKYKNNEFVTDSLSYPTPKLLDEKIQTGHLNFIDNNGIYIPITIHAFNNYEKAFCYQLSNKDLVFDGKAEIKINFVSSWEKFKHYGLIQFYNLYNQNSPELKSLKGKTVIIGVIDTQISSTFETTFDNFMPGVALHAYALDNLEKGRSLNFNFIDISKYVFIIVLLLMVLFVKEEKAEIKTNSILFVGLLLTSFLLFAFLNIELSYMFFILPALILMVIESFNLYSSSRIELAGTLNETEALKNLLDKKEIELEKLQKELNLGDKSSSEVLLNKIKSLKSDIEKLREKEDDNLEAEETTNELKNFEGIVYSSRKMGKVVELIKKVAPENATVLILGESGTGKELVAKAVHSLGMRSENNFVALNCGALSDTLLESELFGHVKGAFTGAVADKKGRFEIADKGTIFLDEIGETTENFQIKLLRIIQTGDYEKVGSSKTSHSDVRIIAATNKELEAQVKEKKFREDLFYRLNVFKIELPPLRERKEDIELLAVHFLKNDNSELKISKAVVDALKEYEWKGNVRELEGAIKRATIFAKSSDRNIIQLVDLPEEIVKNIKLNFEDMVLESLRNKQFSHSSINETAKELGNVSRTIVSENFRGHAFKVYVENNFDIETAVNLISANKNPEINDRVKSKLKMFLRNVEKDISKLDGQDFDRIKENLNSKYKNLPQKFHVYLDEVIKKFMNTK